MCGGFCLSAILLGVAWFFKRASTAETVIEGVAAAHVSRKGNLGRCRGLLPV